LDPPRPKQCVKCGAPIPFGKFCATHLAEARAENQQIMEQKRLAKGIDPAPVPVAPSPHEPPAHEVDMTVAMAKAQERAQAIVTPGETVEKAENHLAQAGPPRDTTRTVGINAGTLNQAGLNDVPPDPTPSLVLPAGAAQQVSVRRRGDDFLVSQGVMWLGELRGLAEEGKITREQAAEILQLTAELNYALAGILK
jgi:hypothetical protein